MPPVINPLASSSAQAPADTLFPGRLGRIEFRGGHVERPHHLELAVLPLAHRARRSRVLAAGELDVAQDGLVRGARNVFTDRLAVQARLANGSGEDFQPGPAGTASPAVRLLAAELLGVRIEVGLGPRARLGVP